MAEFVRDVMTPGVVAVRPDASLVEAAQLMRAQDIGDVVVADGSRVVGMLTDRDIAVRAVAEGADPLTVSAQTVCTPDPVMVAPDDPVSDAITLMREHAVRRLRRSWRAACRSASSPSATWPRRRTPIRRWPTSAGPHPTVRYPGEPGPGRRDPSHRRLRGRR